MASAVDFEAVLLRTLQDDPGLSELVGNKVFALVIPQGTKLPCITFQRLGGMPANTLSGVGPALRRGEGRSQSRARRHARQRRGVRGASD